MVQDIGTDIMIIRDPGLQRHFCSLTVGKDGCVLAADTCNEEVCIFDRSGCVVKHFQVKQASSRCIYGIAEVQERMLLLVIIARTASQFTRQMGSLFRSSMSAVDRLVLQ